MLYGTAEFRKNFYIKLRQMTGIILPARACGGVTAKDLHAEDLGLRATEVGARCRGSTRSQE